MGGGAMSSVVRVMFQHVRGSGGLLRTCRAFSSRPPTKPTGASGTGWTKRDIEMSKAAKAHYKKDEQLWNMMTFDMKWGITHPATWGLAAGIAVLAYLNQQKQEEKKIIDALDRQLEEAQLAKIKAR